MTYRIAIDEGSAVRTLDVGDARLSVGTSSTCRLRLAAAGVASRHATFRQKGDHLIVEDVSQAPNITVDGRSVARAEVTVGQVIGIGAAKIRVLEVTPEKVEPAAATSAPPAKEKESPAAASSPAPAASPVSSAPPASPVSSAPTTSPTTTESPTPTASSTPSVSPTASNSSGSSASPASSVPPPANGANAATRAPRTKRLPRTFPAAPKPGTPTKAAVLPASRRDRSKRRFAAPATASVVFHVALMIVLQFAVPMGGGTREEDGRFSLRATDRPDVFDIADVPFVPEPVAWDEKPAEMPLPDAPLVDLTDLTIPTVLAEAAPEPPPEEPVLAEPLLDRIVRAPSAEPPAEEPRGVIGAGEDGSGPPAVPSRSFGKGEAGKANGLATELLAGDRGGGGALRKVRGLASDDRIWVVHGDYDQAERVLQGLEIAHRVVAQSVLESSEVPKSVRVIVFNCSGKPLSDAAARRIAAWVEAGGCLLSSDWGLDRVVTRSFPGRLKILRTGVKTSLTRDETIEARACGTHELLEGVSTDRAFRWWLEDSSVPFLVADDVEVLVRSPELGRRNGADAVAATFTHGRGRVLHVLGHVFQQEGTLSGAYAMQRIVVNFLGRALGD